MNNGTTPLTDTITERIPAHQRMFANWRSTPMSPQLFAAKCEEIVLFKRGHAAHRALDLLTNELLNSLGYSEGISIFEAAVSRWHGESDSYPYTGPCPDCEQA